jgi:DNA-binding transcriptional MerR regulator
VPALLTIGEFSRASYLTVKTLRHYHDVGLLEPADVDDWSGYRYYRGDQIQTAQAIRRLRELEMPVEQVKGVLHAADASERNALIAAHLERMEQQLERTTAAVASRSSSARSHQRPRCRYRRSSVWTSWSRGGPRRLMSSPAR